jgi:hypothetical protein
MNDKAADAVPQRSAPKQDVFETTDLEVGRAFMNTAYGTRLRMRGTEGNQLLRHARYDLGSFSLDDAILSMETSYRADPLANSLAVVEPRTGWVEHESAGLMEHTGVGDLSIISPPDLPFNAHTQNLHYGAVVLDVPLLMQVAGSAEDGACARPRFTSLRPTSPAAAGLWRSTVGYVRDVLASSPEVFSEPLVLGSTARLLAAAALTTFPNTAIGEPTSKDRNDATSATVHRALVFIE